MNFHYWLRRICRRPTCILGSGAKLLRTAKILNINSSKNITIGRNSVIASELFTLSPHATIYIGEWCFIGEGTRIWSFKSIIIGSRTLISHNVNIFDSLTHPINKMDRHEHFKNIVQVGHKNRKDLDEKPVIIEEDVWIGANSSILRGVHIGEGAIIGVGSVVTSNVPKNTVVVGNPARVIRHLS